MGTKSAGWRQLMVLALLAMLFQALPAVAQSCLHDGDVNQDGNLTPADALLAFQHFLTIAVPPLDDCQQDRADVLDPVDPGSGVTPADALCIFQRFLRLPSCLDPVPAQLAIVSGNGVQVIADTPHRLVVRVRDAEGEPAAAIRVTFRITSGDGVLLAPDVETDSTGEAIATLTVGKNGTPPHIEARVANMAPVSFVITGVIEVERPQQVPISGNNQTVAVGEIIQAPLVVRVEDEFGNPVVGVEVTAKIVQGEAEFVSPTAPLAFALRAPGATAVLAEASQDTTVVAVTNAQGEAEFSLRALGIATDIKVEVAFLDQVSEFTVAVTLGAALRLRPSLVGLVPAETIRVSLLLSAPLSTDLPLSFIVVDPTVVRVPDVVVTAGQTEQKIDIIGLTKGNTTIRLNTNQNPPAMIASVSDPVLGTPLVDNFYPFLAPLVCVALSPSPGGQLFVGSLGETTLSVPLLGEPAVSDTPVQVRSSNPAVANVTGPVVIASGSRLAAFTLNAGQAGEATLFFQAGATTGQLTAYVGAQPEDRTPPILAPRVGLALSPSPGGQLFVGSLGETTLSVPLLGEPAVSETPVQVHSSNPAVADVTGPVVVASGSRLAVFTLDAGQAGEATLFWDMEMASGQFTVYVGEPPEDRIPPVLAPIVGLEIVGE